MSKPTVAFVIQRYGPMVAGGAESVARSLAKRMSACWNVEVLTTCAEDYMTWADVYPAGTTQDGAVTVRRFPVPKPRDPEPFGIWCGKIEHTPEQVPRAEAEAWMRAQGPDCPGIRNWLKLHCDGYAAVLCFTYLYTSSYDALLAAPKGKRVVVPFAHQEWPIRLNIWPEWFAAADRIVYSAEEEQTLVEGLFPAVAGRGQVLGQGFDPCLPGNAPRFRVKTGISREFLLYLGRIDRNKGINELLEMHAWQRERDPLAPDLVLIGKDALNPPPRPGVHLLGFVDEQTKADALAACRALINPSANESLSLALLEAWDAGKPTIANGHCEVMVGQSRRSGGGLWYHDRFEYAAAWHVLRASPPDATGAGRWARQRYAWDRIIAGYQALVQNLAQG